VGVILLDEAPQVRGFFLPALSMVEDNLLDGIKLVPVIRYLRMRLRLLS